MKDTTANWEKYQQNLQELMVMGEVNRFDSSMSNSRVIISPETDIALQHQLVVPDVTKSELISKNLRISNLKQIDHAKINVGGMLLTYLNGLVKSKNLELDKNLSLLEEEILEDINIVQNTSVSRNGWFLAELLSPRKRFQMVPDREGKKLERDK
jgi:hypothetical protein